MLSDAFYSYRDGDQEFAWSPDSHYLLATYQAGGGWNNVDIALIDIDNGQVTNLTQSGYTDVSFRGTLGGKAITWLSDKNGYRSHGSWGAEGDIYAMFFDEEAYWKFIRGKDLDSIEKLLSDEKEKPAKKDTAKAEKPEKGTASPPAPRPPMKDCAERTRKIVPGSLLSALPRRAAMDSMPSLRSVLGTSFRL